MCRAAVVLAVVVALAAVSSAQSCAVANSSKVDCGYFGITESACEAKSCCWQPEGPNSALPYCFFPLPGDAPFNATELALLMGYFTANINIDGNGGVVASPDLNTPGGSYYYHWMRDAALSMRTLQMVSSFETVRPVMESYVGWVLRAQAAVDPNSIDVRTEPKFFLPDGGVFTGAWCRPQTDGPALRATTLILLAQALIEAGDESYVQQYLYTSGAYNGGAIKYDLDWVAANWTANGCDLWEEIQSNDFFWNRAQFRRALYLGSSFAGQMGDTERQQVYLAAAEAVNATLAGHWNGAYVFESTNRPQDSAVLIAFNDGCMADDPIRSQYMCPGTVEAAATAALLENVFYSAFPINAADTAAGVPGVMVGRYPGDTYGGVNPWILCTCALAENYYRAGLSAVRRGELPSADALAVYARTFQLAADSLTLPAFVRATANYGDDILYRIHYHVAPYDFHMSEQIGGTSGGELSATDLTWSYGTALKAMYYRGQLETEAAALGIALA